MSVLSLPLIHEDFLIFSLPCSAEERNDRVALVGTWNPARVKLPQEIPGVKGSVEEEKVNQICIIHLGNFFKNQIIKHMPNCDVTLSKYWSEELFIDLVHEGFSCLLCTFRNLHLDFQRWIFHCEWCIPESKF